MSNWQTRVSGGATLWLDQRDLAAESENLRDTETLDSIKAGAVEVCKINIKIQVL